MYDDNDDDVHNGNDVGWSYWTDAGTHVDINVCPSICSSVCQRYCSCDTLLGVDEDEMPKGLNKMYHINMLCYCFYYCYCWFLLFYFFFLYYFMSMQSIFFSCPSIYAIFTHFKYNKQVICIFSRKKKNKTK